MATGETMAEDLATVQRVREAAEALREVIEAARPAIGRLNAADYPGAGYLRDKMHEAVEDGTGPSYAGELVTLIMAAARLQEADGDRGHYLYLEFDAAGQGVKKALAEIATVTGDPADVEAYLAYLRKREAGQG